MSNALPKDLQKWETTRQKGKGRFILLHGVLGYGVPMFFVMTFVVNRQPERALTLSSIIISAVVWLLGGAAFGVAMWALNEGRYKKALATKTTP